MMDDLNEEDSKHLARQIAWLNSHGPDDWHRVALDFNWDGPLYVLDWIVRQEDCDMATALTIFWKGEPAYWIDDAQSSDEEPNGFSYLNRKLCTYIAGRIGQRGYKRSKIGFAPDAWTKQSFDELVDMESALSQPRFRTHRDLLRRCRGRRVTNDPDFYSRYPAEFHDTVLVEPPGLDFRSFRSIAHWKYIEVCAKLRRLVFNR